jgi:di/tricarboxylate transporter
MNGEQTLALGILAATFALFIWGRWRYDIVAVLALLAVVFSSLLPADQAFQGFAHPAVLTVAAVLVIGRALQNAGIVDVVISAIAPLRGRATLQIAAQTLAVAALSAFMNNVGALALLMPVALRNAHRGGYPPAKSLMALAFGSLLGGLTTLIGTPPNLIVSLYRQEQLGRAFGMFDFTPVGLVVAVAGVTFVITIGWRLLPLDRQSSEAAQPFKIEDYVTEVSVPDGAKADGATVWEVEGMAHDEITILGIIRNQTRRLAPAGYQRIEAGDVVILRGDTDALKNVIDAGGLKLITDERVGPEDLKSEDVDIVEAVVSPRSPLVGRTPIAMRLRTVYGLNLVALAREGRRVAERLGETSIHSGDVLMLQGPRKEMPDTLATLQCLPLAERDHGLGRPRRLITAAGVFAAAIALTMSGMLPVHVSFVAAATALILFNVIKPDEAYEAIDWPVIVLIAAMIPVGSALNSSGATALIADTVLSVTHGLGTIWVMVVLLVATMLLTDVINNNATAVLMAPIAITLAGRLGANVDAFLMLVAIGSSCAFLTPIGHQSNTLVMEPAGYRFGDYWRMGLPLDILIVAVTIPMILLVWPP